MYSVPAYLVFSSLRPDKSKVLFTRWDAELYAAQVGLLDAQVIPVRAFPVCSYEFLRL